MSVIDFAQRLAQLEAAAARAEGKLDQLKNKIDNVKGPMDELIEQAEQTGSAVGNVNGVMIEAVRMSGEVTPVLEGVMWKMYEIQKEAEKTETVSRTFLDALALRMDALIPQYDLWTKHVLQLAADGELKLDELMAKLESMFMDPSTRQLNSMLQGDIDGFLLELRRMKDGIDEAVDKAEDAAERVVEATAGMASAGASGATTMGAAKDKSPGTTGLMAALKITRGRM